VIQNLFGYPITILTNLMMVEPIYKQTFRPKRKKKRIQKKCKKKYTKFIGYKPWEKIFFTGDAVIGHPDIIRKMKESLKREAESYERKWR